MSQKASARARLIQNARRSLGIGFTVKNREVFAACAQKLGVTWDGQKRTGYDLVQQYLGLGIRSRPRVPVTTPKRLVPPESGNAFLMTYAWRSLRMRVITSRGARCECCGATPADGIRINVDHIKPRVKYPELALEESNLQVLCEPCNHGKGNWDETDWRAAEMRPRLVRPA